MDSLDTLTTTEEGGGLHLAVKGLTPYWLDRSSAVKNDVDINSGLLLLTAPNMSGKSTLMRATLVAALLANCGLCIPASTGSRVPRYDCFFIRTSSYDIPSEGKSAFGLEMDDMRVILRDSTPASIVMIDEIGKGTSSRDGAAIAGALLEYLDQRNVSGIFATHLHELLALPLDTQRLHRRRMGMKYTHKTGDRLVYPEWTYRLEEGVCTDSMAIVTARAFGLPDSLISRAESLGGMLDDQVKVKDDQVKVNKEKRRDVISSVVHKPVTVKGLLHDVIETFSSQNLAPPSSSDKHGKLNLYDIAYIPHDSVVPAYLEGQSCLYVLDIESISGNVNEQILYVGESESIAQRFRAHQR
jgi:DNA mismatch repair ATPase MutS